MSHAGQGEADLPENRRVHTYLNSQQKRTSPNEHFAGKFLARKCFPLRYNSLWTSATWEASETAHPAQLLLALCQVSTPTRAELHNTTNRSKGPIPTGRSSLVSECNREKVLLTSENKALPVPRSSSEWCHSELFRHLCSRKTK